MEVLSTPRAYAFADGWYDPKALDHFWFQWRFRLAMEQLRRAGIAGEGPGRLLDVGCGLGILRAQMETATSWIVDGADLDRAALEGILPGRGRALYYDITDENPRLVGTYDGIVLFDVLEHQADPVGFLGSAVRHLRGGGFVLINVPALSLLFSEYDRIQGHYRRYTRRELREVATAAGVAVTTAAYWGMTMIPVVAARKLLMRLLASRPASEQLARGFHPPGPAAHALLRGLMRAELAVWPRPPLGTSILLLGRVAPAPTAAP